MQTPTETASIAGNASATGSLSADTSFAGLLAALATPPKPETGWNDSELAEDVATISYEQALRTHGRSRACEIVPDRQQTSMGCGDASTASLAAHERESTSVAKPPKTASITIRLSEPECAQLRQRAAEAGLTVSAYLRSCTLEVESLRAQVKQTLAQLRAPKPSAPEPEPNRQADGTGGLRGILARLSEWFRQLGPSRRPDFRLNPGNPFAPVP